MHLRVSRIAREWLFVLGSPRSARAALPQFWVALALATAPAAGAGLRTDAPNTRDAAAIRAAQAHVAELGSELERAMRADTLRRAQSSAPDADAVLADARQFYSHLRSQPLGVGTVPPAGGANRITGVRAVSPRRPGLAGRRLKTAPAIASSPKRRLLGNRLLLYRALSYRGAPYRWGGSSRKGLDCSGLVLRVLSELGQKAPHSAALQFRLGQPVAEGDLQPGDLVFFRDTYKPGISHVGIYQGTFWFIHASSASGRVTVGNLADPYFRRRYAGAKRVLPPDAAGTSLLDAQPPGEPFFAPFRLGLP